MKKDAYSNTKYGVWIIPIVTALVILLLAMGTSALISKSEENLEVRSMEGAQEMDDWAEKVLKELQIYKDEMELFFSDDDELLQEFLESTYGVHESFPIGLYMGDEDGNYYDGAGWVPDDDYDLTTRPWYTQALGKKDFVFSEPYVDAQTGKICISISAQLKETAFEKTTILATDVYLDYAQHLVYNLVESGDLDGAMFVSADNIVIADFAHGSNAEYIMEDEEEFHKTVGQMIIDGEVGIHVVDDENGKANYVDIVKLGVTGWTLVTTVKRTTLLESFYKVIVYMVIAAVIAILALSFLMRKYTQNVIELGAKANTDKLTQLMNREGFEKAVNEELSVLPGQGLLLLFDLDHFKDINDHFGHPEGDRTLVSFANMLKDYFNRNGDIPARLGGDEFAVFVARDMSPETAEKMVGKFLDEFRRTLMPKYGRYGFGVSVGGAFAYEDEFAATGATIGIKEDKEASGTDGAEGTDDATTDGAKHAPSNYSDLYKRTDRVLYRVKESGRNGFIIEKPHNAYRRYVFKRDLSDARTEDREIIKDVYEAMNHGELKPYFQPKVDIRDNTIIGAEALIRWEREDGVIPPESFLPILENTGDICRVDMYCFEEVCIKMKEWEDKGLLLPTVSCNFSMKHLADNEFTQDIRDIADRYGVNHKKLEIEMTETVSPEEVATLRHIIQELRSMGFRTALDDFGTGFSSLSLIKDIPIDVIKPDKSLLSSMSDLTQLEDKDRTLMTHIVGLVKDMQMMCVAEGVETVRQKDFLKSIGCNYVQGFLYDGPLEADAFEAKIIEGKYDLGEDEETETKSKYSQGGFNERILLVEDNEINREITVNILEALGATVETAVDGQDAFDKFKAAPEGSFDVVLMDIQMPVMNGYESTRAIRALDREDAKNIPIVAITVDVYKETREQSLDAGMTGYVTKPLDPVRLSDVLSRIEKGEELPK